MKKKDILSFSTTWKRPEDIMPSEITQIGKINTVMILPICGIFKSQTHGNRK